MSKPIVSFKNVSKNYKVGSEIICALDSISLEINTGEIVAIVGASGSGKSTLMQIMGTLDKPTSGEINVNEQNIARLSDADLSYFRNQTIGFVFQQFYLQPYLTISQNVEVSLIFGKMDKKARREKVTDALKSVGIENRSKHLPSEISGGQMQRVAIARAVVTKPKIILADEPTGNLDSGNRKEVLELFKKINKEFGTTIVIITHDEEIAKQADRIIKLYDGRIVE